MVQPNHHGHMAAKPRPQGVSLEHQLLERRGQLGRLEAVSHWCQGLPTRPIMGIADQRMAAVCLAPRAPFQVDTLGTLKSVKHKLTDRPAVQECQVLEEQLGHGRERAQLQARLLEAEAALQSTQQDQAQQSQVRPKPTHLHTMAASIYGCQWLHKQLHSQSDALAGLAALSR